jgi:hypothetical protein
MRIGLLIFWVGYDSFLNYDNREYTYLGQG